MGEKSGSAFLRRGIGKDSLAWLDFIFGLAWSLGAMDLVGFGQGFFFSGTVGWEGAYNHI